MRRGRTGRGRVLLVPPRQGRHAAHGAVGEELERWPRLRHRPDRDRRRPLRLGRHAGHLRRQRHGQRGLLRVQPSDRVQPVARRRAAAHQRQFAVHRLACLREQSFDHQRALHQQLVVRAEYRLRVRLRGAELLGRQLSALLHGRHLLRRELPPGQRESRLRPRTDLERQSGLDLWFPGNRQPRRRRRRADLHPAASRRSRQGTRSVQLPLGRLH